MAEVRNTVRKRQASFFSEKYDNKKIRTVKTVKELRLTSDDKSDSNDEDEQESGDGLEIDRNQVMNLELRKVMNYL